MQSKSAALQDEINTLNYLIQNGKTEDGSQANDAQLTLLEIKRDEKRKELIVALAEEAQEQVVTESAGYALDTMEVDGLTAPEIITDDAQYNLIRKGFQIYIMGMNTTHLNLINALKAEHRQEIENIRECMSCETLRADQMQSDNKDLEVKNYQLGLDNDELENKVRKGAELLAEATSQIDQQKKHIEDLRAQQTLGIRQALNIVTEPQDTTGFKAEIDASKPRITDVKYKDEFGIDRRTKTAVEVLTGKPIEYQEYVEKRYIILNAEQAEQYRADEANKKAEIEAQQAAIPTLAVPELEPVNPVTEVVEAVNENPFPIEEEVRTAVAMAEGSSSSDREVATEENEVVTRAEFEQALARIERIERHANIQAVA
jgi:hypothetical protein